MQNKEFEKLCKLVGIGPKEPCKYGFGCGHAKPCCPREKTLPILTADKMLDLEELVIKKYSPINQGEDSEGYFYQVGFYCDFDDWGYKYQSIGKTRPKVLCNLLIQLIEQDIISKEDVREVIEK